MSIGGRGIGHGIGHGHATAGLDLSCPALISEGRASPSLENPFDVSMT
jgi:hypothetical protein